jgi:hypothetical protein
VLPFVQRRKGIRKRFRHAGKIAVPAGTAQAFSAGRF